MIFRLCVQHHQIGEIASEKYKDYKWKKDYALHVENIDRKNKGLPPIQPKKSIIVEFLKARKARVCPVIEYKAE